MTLASGFRDAPRAIAANRNLREDVVSMRELAHLTDTVDCAQIFLSAGRLADAQSVCQHILTCKPDDAGAVHVLGLVAQESGHSEQAAELFRRSISLQPSVADFHNDLGNSLADLGRFNEAAMAYRQAIHLRPNYAQAHANLGHVLMEMAQLDAAEAAYRRAIEFQPNFGPLYADLANLLRRIDRLDDAARALAAAERLAQPCPEIAHACHLLLQRQRQWDQAQQTLEAAIIQWPKHAQLHVSLAICLLTRGQFERGWQEYEWRWQTPQRRGDLRLFPQSLWDGTQRQGKRLLLHSEQGLGTSFQFVRYAPLLAEQGYEVILECQPALKRILSSLPRVTVVARGEPLPPFDVHAPLLSVPRIVGTTLTSIPSEVPYMQADSQLMARSRQELSRYPGLKIGIAWQGNPAFPDDWQRSIPLRHFAPLAAVKRVTLINLQQKFGLEQMQAAADQVPLVNLGLDVDGEHGAFMDTAAVMMGLDLVVTSDTSIAHLAGALGVPVWVALCHMPDWRWLLDREDSPWYPTMRLFRQKQPGGWEEVFDRIASATTQLETKAIL